MNDIHKINHLPGRKAIVIGAGRGIGREIARYLSQAGATVFILSRSLNQLEVTKEMIVKETGNEVKLFKVDVSSSEEMDEFFSQLKAIDILVNVAGVSAQKPAEHYDKKLFNRIYDINCHGLYYACAKAYPFLKNSPYGGKVINIASHLGIVGLPLRSIYCSSKAAVIHYTKTLAAEWATSKINVNCIAPGYVATELANRVLENPVFRSEVLEKTPLGFIGEVGDIAGAAVFLASDASRYMTGQTMVIDGGWSCV